MAVVRKKFETAVSFQCNRGEREKASEGVVVEYWSDFNEKGEYVGTKPAVICHNVTFCGGSCPYK